MSDRMRSSDTYVDDLLEETHAAETKPQKRAAAVRAAGYDPDSDVGKRVLAIAKEKDTTDPWQIAREAAAADVDQPPPAEPEWTRSPVGMQRRIDELNAQGDYVEAARLERHLKRLVEQTEAGTGLTDRERTRREAAAVRREELAGEIVRESGNPADRVAEMSGFNPDDLRADYVIEGEMAKAQHEGDYATAAARERELARMRAEESQQTKASPSPTQQLNDSQNLEGLRRQEADARAAGDYPTAASYERQIAKLAQQSGGNRREKPWIARYVESLQKGEPTPPIH